MKGVLNELVSHSTGADSSSSGECKTVSPIVTVERYGGRVDGFEPTNLKDLESNLVLAGIADDRVLPSSCFGFGKPVKSQTAAGPDVILRNSSDHRRLPVV